MFGEHELCAMIIVVEGPTATGKSTWITRHCPPEVVVPEGEAGTAPKRSVEAEAAAHFWAGYNASRWALALESEQRYGTAVCDTDPFKLHYVWCLWQTGHADHGQWRAELRANRSYFAKGRHGFADLVLVEVPDRSTLETRRDADRSRKRANFDLHVEMAEPLRQWYAALGRLEPSRVRWELPATGLRGLKPDPRQPRCGVELFDAFIDQLPAR